MQDFVSNSGDEPAYKRNEAKHNHLIGVRTTTKILSYPAMYIPINNIKI